MNRYELNKLNEEVKRLTIENEGLTSRIEQLDKKIRGLEKDLDYQTEQNHNNTKLWNAIAEIQDELLKKGFWFDHRL